MTRSILAALTIAVVVVATSGTGCQSTGVGDPCTPEQEYAASFLGFSANEVNVESKSFQCQTRLCLVNHFQGRVSCPYGQDSGGNAISPAKSGCVTPGISLQVDGKDPSGNYIDMKAQATVEPQCIDRSADKAVYCSCRCANVNGKNDDGANYCTCPDNYDCTQLVSSIGQGNEGLTGAYCIKHGTAYDPNNNCNNHCDPGLANCGNTQLTGP
jgi:hypothetical protein